MGLQVRSHFGLYMNHITALTWSWLNVLTKKRYDALMEVYGDLDDALAHIDAQILKGLNCRDDTIQTTLDRLKTFDLKSYEQDLNRRNITFINIEESSYPLRLLELPDPPVFLYAKGSIEILNQPCVAIVGTRNMSSYGKRVVSDLAPKFVHAGLVTVSGLAIGIDSQVARETLEAAGKTVAVLGHGLSCMHPKCNAQLADEIVANGGLLLSEFPLDMAPGKYTFPARNRIIAGLSMGTVVAEAGEGSGALITAELALEYGRDVFAVSGQMFDPHFAGCHQLISRGHAKLIVAASDVLQELGIVIPSGSTKKQYEPQNEHEELLYAALTTMPKSVTEVVEHTDLDVATTNAVLTVLELRGVVRNSGGGMWVRC